MTQSISGFHIENTLTHQFLTATRLLTRNLAKRYQAAVDLTLAELSVLHAIGLEPGISPTAVAEQTRHDKVRVSRAVQALQRRGLVRKDTHAADGRARVLRLTKRGVQVFAASIAAVEEGSDVLAGALSASERDRFARTPEKLRENLPTAPEAN